ncbi:MAG: hypothetical protein ACK2T5_13760 [Anaerolineales bacterium]|jgi:hypothetical protein
MSNIEIRIEGHLDPAWADWLEGFTIQHLEENVTLLTGTVSDQAALYGLIAKLRDLGVKLISVNFGDPPIKYDSMEE